MRGKRLKICKVEGKTEIWGGKVKERVNLRDKQRYERGKR